MASYSKKVCVCVHSFYINIPPPLDCWAPDFTFLLFIDAPLIYGQGFSNSPTTKKMIHIFVVIPKKFNHPPRNTCEIFSLVFFRSFTMARDTVW